eukprot:IDg2220t1
MVGSGLVKCACSRVLEMHEKSKAIHVYRVPPIISHSLHIRMRSYSWVIYFATSLTILEIAVLCVARKVVQRS